MPIPRESPHQGSHSFDLFTAWQQSLAKLKEDQPELFEVVILLQDVLTFEAICIQTEGREKEQHPEKPLATTERNTLLTIIASLCKEAKLDYTKHAKTAGLIQSIAAGMGLSIGETTIEGHLKKIPNALAGRMK